MHCIKKLPNQNFVLLNLAHKHHRPVVSENPCIRILGVFGSPDETRAWLQEYHKVVPIPTLQCETHQFMPVLENPEGYATIQDSLEDMRKVREEAFKSKLAREQEEIMNLKRPSSDDDEEEEEIKEQQPETATPAKKPAMEIPFSLRQFDRFFVVSLYKDTDKIKKEHAFKIWGAASTLTEAKTLLDSILKFEQASHLYVMEANKWFDLSQILTDGYIYKHQIPHKFEIEENRGGKDDDDAICAASGL